jgi:hypothetical protein
MEWVPGEELLLVCGWERTVLEESYAVKTPDFEERPDKERSSLMAYENSE